MRIRPFLLLYRKRCIVTALLSILAAFLLLLFTCMDTPKQIGVLWHTSPVSPATALDAVLLVNLSTATCLFIGLLMGIGFGSRSTLPGLIYGEMRFLLTRPMRRSEVLLVPVGLALGAIVLLPAAGLSLLLAWLKLVHAPVLGHLLEIARLIPGAAEMGQHPSLLTVLRATQYGRFYAASVSVGLCVFALYYVQRWWAHSQSKWMRRASALTMLVPAVPFFLLHTHGIAAWVFLLSRAGEQPSLYAMAIHGMFALVMLGSCWRIAQRIEV